MMNKTIQDQIQLYLLNRLSSTDKVIFEQLIQNDPELKKEVQLQKQIAEALEYMGSMEAKAYLKKSVQNWRQYVPELKKSTFTEKIQHSIEHLNNLVLQFFNPYTAAFRNAVIEQFSIQDQAFFYYNKKEYSKAIPLLLKLPREDQEVQMMIGNAYLAQKDYEIAYSNFKQLIENEAIFFLSEAHWYSSLCLTALNQLEEALKHIHYLINDENTSNEIRLNAKTLLQKLSQLT